ncbi:ABC transporter ATP-binding protein [Nocardioides sp. LS1]|uniref:ABC transporter ATP-binding protein n=1 Tax=Nocardioides sp. LS1 TaxID=1027620 RepID=UPI000F617505|nr:ATP-binding cassette domain-containing protein [Nocardioides sp. LS1]
MTRRFGGVVAVQRVDLDLPPGSRRALLGPNGAGKTTLVNLIAGDFRPDEGSINLFGVDVTHESGRRRVSRGLGRTYQRSRTFPGLTAQDNVEVALIGAFGGTWSLRPGGRRRDARRAAAAELLDRVGMAAKLGHVSGSLSHGEHRQLELAMGLAGDPRLLILDEPAAGLSPSERETLTGLLLGLEPGLSVLLIEHDMNVALTVADSVTVMADGHVVFDGTPDEIRASDKVHDIYLGNAHV